MTDPNSLASLIEEMDLILEEPITPTRQKVKSLGGANPHTATTRPVALHPTPAPQHQPPKPVGPQHAPSAQQHAAPKTQAVQSFPPGHPAQAGTKAPPKPQHPTQVAAFPAGHPARSLPTTPHPAAATPTATPTGSGGKTSVSGPPTGMSSGPATAHSKPTSVNHDLAGFAGSPKPKPTASPSGPPAPVVPKPTPAMQAAAAAPVAPKVPGRPDAQRCPPGSHKGPTGACVPREQLQQQMDTHQSQAAIHRDNYQSHAQAAQQARASGDHKLAAHHDSEAAKSIQAATHHHGQFKAHQDALFPAPAQHATIPKGTRVEMPAVKRVSQGTFGMRRWGSSDGTQQPPHPDSQPPAQSPSQPAATPAATPTAPSSGGQSPSIWSRLGNAALHGAGQAALSKGKKNDSFLWSALGHALGSMVHDPNATPAAQPAAPAAAPRSPAPVAPAAQPAAPAARPPAAPTPTAVPQQRRVSSTAKTTRMPAYDPFATPPQPRRQPTMAAPR